MGNKSSQVIAASAQDFFSNGVAVEGSSLNLASLGVVGINVAIPPGVNVCRLRRR